MRMIAKSKLEINVGAPIAININIHSRSNEIITHCLKLAIKCVINTCPLK